MPIYDYRAYNANGKVYESTLESSTLLDARTKLFEGGISYVSLKEGKKKRTKRISKQSLLLFTEQLYELLQADIPLFESLKLLKEQFRQDSFFPILDRLCESLSTGISFSDALTQFPEHFDLLYCTLVQMGEQSGHLDEALRRISKEIAKSCSLQKRLRTALLYPSILAVFCTLVIGVLMFYVIPSIESLFEASSMGTFTRVVIDMCHHLKRWTILYLIIIAFFSVLVRSLLKFPKYKRKADELTLMLPQIKNFAIDFELSRWTSTISLLLKGGVPFLDAMKLGEKLISNTLLKEVLCHCKEKVSEGSKLSDELKKYSFFSPVLVRVIAIGENSGDLVASFDKLSHLLEEDVDKKLNKFMTLLAPISLMIMATIIGLIMLAILIPLTDINSLLN